MHQFFKFACVGVLNALIDLGVLNLLIILFAISSGSGYVLAKGISFSCAVINSYMWNRNWAFKKVSTDKTSSPFSKKLIPEKLSFLCVSLVGLFLNTAVAYIIFSLGIHMYPQVSSELVENVAAVCGIIAVLFSNFLGYKYLVFNV